MAKQSRLMIAFFAMILLMVSLASASLLVSPGSINFNSTSLTKTITLNNTGNTNITNVSVVFSDLVFGSHVIEAGNFSNSPNFNITNNSVKDISIKLDGNTIPDTQYAGSYIGNINFSNGTVSTIVSVNYTIEKKPSLSIATSSIQDSQNKTSIIITNNGNVNLSGHLNFSSEEISGVKVSGSDILFNLEPSQSKTITLNLSISTSSKVETVRIPIMAITSDYNSSSVDLSIERSYCRYGKVGSLIRVYDVEDRRSDWEWKPLQEVTIRFYVDNLASTRKTITTKLALFDSSGKTVWLSADEKELSDSQRIDDNEDARFEFKFTLPADFKINENYYLHVKAYDKENEQCDSASEIILIDSDDDIIIDEISYPSLMNCDSLNDISFKVYNLNLGDEELMRIGLYNRELGINLFSSQIELDEGENEDVSFNLRIPSGITPKTYRFTVFVEYDYRDSSDTYRRSKDIQIISLNVQGDNCVNLQNRPVVTATLGSDAIEGKELVVLVSVKNNANLSTSITLSPEDFESWAKLTSVNPSALTIDANKDGNFNITFIPTKDGQQSFNLKVFYNGKSFDQPVSISIENNDSWIVFLKNKFGTFGAYLVMGIAILFILILLIVLVRLIMRLFK